MNERIKQLLAKIEKIQAARKLNWKSPDGPENEQLEASHAQQIRECRNQIQQLAPCKP